LTIVIVSVTGRPARPSVMSCRKNALLLIMPVRSGYGPAVSSGVTTQLAAPAVGVVVVVVAVVVAAAGLAEEPLQAAASAAPAMLSNSSALRRLTAWGAGVSVVDSK
jgi:hypothetical protein